MKRLLSATLLMALSGCSAQGYVVHHIKDGSGPLTEPAVYYALPRTVVMMTFDATLTKITPGKCGDKDAIRPLIEGARAAELAWVSRQVEKLEKEITALRDGTSDADVKNYSEKSVAMRRLLTEKATYEVMPWDLLGIDESALVKVATREVKVETPTLGTRVEIDPNHIYAVELTQKFLKTNKHTYDFSEDGLLAKSGLESESKVVDTAVSVLGAAAGIGSKVLGFGADAAVKPHYCQEVAKDVLELRATQRRIVNGDASSPNANSKESLEYMVGQLKAAEDRLLEEFTGKKKTSTTKVTCEVTPEALGVSDKTLFTLHKSEGLSTVDPGCFANDELKAMGTPGGTAYLLSITPVGKKLAELAAKSNKESNGIRYRIPAQAKVTLKQGAERVQEQRIRIAQFGEVLTLPGDDDVSSKSAAFAIALHPEIGSLDTIDANFQAVDMAGLAAKGAESAEKVMGAIKDKRAGDKAAENEALLREKTRLELQRDIAKLKSEQP